MNALLHDPIFFYAIAFVIFLALAVWQRKPGLDWIDGEINRIRDELDQAKALRAEAEKFLSESKAKKRTALAEAKAILEHAREESERLKKEAESNLKYVLERHEQHAMERIRIVEQEALADVRAAAVDIAMGLVRETLAARTEDADMARLTDQAIADMPKLSVAKAKAA